VNDVNYDINMEDDRRHWHLDKRLNLGHIGMTFTLAAGVFWWASGVEQQVGGNTKEIIHAKEIMHIEQQHVRGTVEIIDGKVDKLDSKMDKLLDRMNTTYLNGNGDRPR